MVNLFIITENSNNKQIMIVNLGSDNVHQQLTRISELKQQLIGIGYHPTQLNDIVREVIGKTSLESITAEQSRELIESLEYYCDFAIKCKKGNCKK